MITDFLYINLAPIIGPTFCHFNIVCTGLRHKGAKCITVKTKILFMIIIFGMYKHGIFKRDFPDFEE